MKSHFYGLSQIDEPLDFGKYQNYSLRQIFSGWQHPSQYFIEFYIKRVFGFLNEANKINKFTTFDIKEFSFIHPGHLKIEIDTKGNLLDINFFTRFMNHNLIASQSYPTKNDYGEINAIIIQHNRSAGDVEPKFELFADAYYLEWLIDNVPSFMMEQDLIEELQRMTCTYFEGISILHLRDNLFKYEVEGNRRIYKFRAHHIKKNEEKCLKFETRWNAFYEAKQKKEEQNERDDNSLDKLFSGGCPICGSSGACMASDPQDCPSGLF